MSSSINIPLTVDATQSGLAAGTPVYMYVVGLVSAATNTYYWLDASGMPQVMSTSDNTIPAGTFPGSGTLSPAAVTAIQPNYPLAWADYSIPVSLTAPTSINLANINPTNCPGLGTGTAAFSGRVYISIGVPKLPFSPTDGGYTAPVPLTPPGYLTLFDWIEFSFDSDGNFNGNTTQVDQFGFELKLNGTPGGSLQGQLNQSRADILSAFGSSLAAPFGGGILQVAVPANAAPAYPSGTDYLRVVSPKTLTGPPTYTGPLASYFDAVIAQSYTTWQTTPLVTYDTSTGYYTGVAEPLPGSPHGILTFYQGNYSTLQALRAANPPVAFQLTGTDPKTAVILTADVWQCANTLASGTDAQKNVGKMLAAAYNRGVIANLLDDSTCQNDAASFYPANGTWNVWAQMFHRFSTNGLAYGFPYDDVCNQNPSISLIGTQSVTITLGPFNSGS
ncbi:MAG TPA: beta-1,3-glucanase family protein [Blastocatellia bacterium]|nr:beta-1,3-glucanase family protein [Blastocatellia bacterium]